MSTKFTAQHFPKGTIISTSLYTTNEEGLTFMRFGTNKPASFTVDHVRVADTWSGRIYLLVTTTRKEKPLFEGDDFIAFNIGHVDRIVKLGKVIDIRYHSEQWVRSKHYCGTNFYDHYEIPMYLMNFFIRLQPYNQFNYKLAVAAFLKSNAVRQVLSLDSSYWQRCLLCVVNKKKTKAWVKQNINRFIFTQKEIEEQERLADIELNRDLKDAISFDMSLDIDDEFPKHKHYGDDDYYLTQPNY